VPNPLTIEEVIASLAQEYGQKALYSHLDPLSELIRTVLSQNTSDINSWRAFYSLRDTFGGWEAVAEAGVEEIAAAIWGGGLARVKAPRIKAILQNVKEKRGSLDLSFLAEMPLDKAKAWLRQWPGVGPKTAACVLLFSLGRPALPVDTHVHRVARRLGLLGDRVSAEKAHDLLETMVTPGKVYLFHVTMVEHGRKICQAQPRCQECIFRKSCPSSRAP